MARGAVSGAKRDAPLGRTRILPLIGRTTTVLWNTGVSGGGGVMRGAGVGAGAAEAGAPGPIATTRISASPEDAVSQAATPTWSGAAATRREPKFWLRWTKTLPDCQLVPSSDTACIR